jgi:hypothetical protein
MCYLECCWYCVNIVVVLVSDIKLCNMAWSGSKCRDLRWREHEVECGSINRWMCGIWWLSSAMCWTRNWGVVRGNYWQQWREAAEAVCEPMLAFAKCLGTDRRFLDGVSDVPESVTWNLCKLKNNICSLFEKDKTSNTQHVFETIGTAYSLWTVS